MSIKNRNPMTTRTGRPRLGPLNFRQLHELMNRSQKPKERVKIRNRISQLEKILGYKYQPEEKEQ
jgi:hypothetical protein